MADRVNILAFDTSTHACTVALLTAQEGAEPHLHTDHRIAPMQHTQLILPMIETMLKQGHLSPADLSAIAVGIGPGSFTGCRLGVSVAQGLGFANHLPLVPVSSMAALAMSVFMEHGHRWVLVALDARTEQIYVGGYHITEAGEVDCVIPEQLLPVGAFQWSKNNPWVGVGDAWQSTDSPSLILAEAYPQAAAVAKIGLNLYQRGVHCLPALLEPAYLR